MSQPPQNGWGPQQPDQPHGQSSPDGGYGDYGRPPHDGYGQPSPSEGYGGHGHGPQDGYGPPSPSEGYGSGYGQASPEGYGGYGQASPEGYGGYGQASPEGYDQGQAAAPGFGPSFSNDMPHQGEPPTKNKATIPLIICAGCAVLALIVAILGGGIWLLTRDGGESTGGGGATTQDPTEQPPTEDEPTEDEPTEEQPTEDEPTEEQPTDDGGDGAGTRDQPYAVGETFTLDDGEDGTIDVSFGNVVWDATDDIVNESSLNQPPEDGMVYMMVPVTITYHGDGSLMPSTALDVSYVADTGNSYSYEIVMFPPNSAYDQDDLYDGGSVEFNVPFTVPEGTSGGGQFAVSSLFDFMADDVFVVAE